MRLGAKRRCDLLDDEDSGISDPPLDAADVGAVKLGLKAELLLAEPAFTTQTPYIASDTTLNIHFAMEPKRPSRLDRKATSVSLLVVLGVRRDGQIVIAPEALLLISNTLCNGTLVRDPQLCLAASDLTESLEADCETSPACACEVQATPGFQHRVPLVWR
jgi:hypothetical protein